MPHGSGGLVDRLGGVAARHESVGRMKEGGGLRPLGRSTAFDPPRARRGVIGVR